MESRPAGVQMIAPQRVRQEEILVMGLEVRTTHRREQNPATAEIPKLWERFLSEQLWLGIPDILDRHSFYGVYTDYEHKPDLEYCLIAAVEVSSIDNPPENMVGLTIPSGDYLVFQSINCSSLAVRQTWQQVEDFFSAANRAEQRAFTTDFERYDEQQVSIYIAIR